MDWREHSSSLILNHLFLHRICISIAGILSVLAMVFSACSNGPVTEQSDEEKNRNLIPVLTTTDVNTLISDSGITRYRIESPLWLVYDKHNPPFQEFPKGIYLEQFDENLKVQASLKADYAYYNEEMQIWIIRGNVHALNHKGEQFDTPNLNWNQQTHRVYSDSCIRITRETSIIEGIGFESNEQMTKYTILHPTGVFPIKD